MDMTRAIDTTLLKDKNNSTTTAPPMDGIKTMLKQNAFNQVKTPLILNYTQAIPYMTTATQQSQVKLQGPSGEMLILRGDSTIALVISDVLKGFEDEAKAPIRLFYDEPNYSHDFEKRVIREVRQIGVEIIQKAPIEVAFTEALSLALSVAQMTCGTDIMVEFSQATLLKTVIATLVENDEKQLDSLMYYLNRKNTREAVKILSETRLGTSAQAVVENLLTTPRALDAYIAELEAFKAIEAFDPLSQWLANLKASIGVNIGDLGDASWLYFDPSFTVDKPYYTGETFKVYDTKRHIMRITGGTYGFEPYGINGCGFSILDGGTV